MINPSKKVYIQTSKDILGGQPVFRGTRVGVHTLIDYLEAGECLGDFLKDYPTVTKKQAIAVLELAKKGIAKG